MNDNNFEAQTLAQQRQYKHIKLEISGKTAYVTVSNPKTLNALDTATLNELNGCFKDIERDPALRVIIITGAGQKAFVAGADISEMASADAMAARELSFLGQETFGRLEAMGKVSIAAVNGYALGGGCELAMACDIRVASENAVFAQPECGLGILPGFGGTQRLARLVGSGTAKELIFTCRRIDAQEACRIGLVNKVVCGESLMDECRTIADRVIKNSGSAVALAKASIDTGLDCGMKSGLELEAASFALSFATADKAEGMNAFLNRRTAEFQ